MYIRVKTAGFVVDATRRERGAWRNVLFVGISILRVTMAHANLALNQNDNVEIRDARSRIHIISSTNDYSSRRFWYHIELHVIVFITSQLAAL